MKALDLNKLSPLLNWSGVAMGSESSGPAHLSFCCVLPRDKNRVEKEEQVLLSNSIQKDGKRRFVPKIMLTFFTNQWQSLLS